MTVMSRLNALLNASFDLWDYGSSAALDALPSHGYVANRWKVTRLGAGAGSVSQVSTPNSTAVSKWMRNRPALRVSVTGLTTEGTVKIAQTIENAVLWHRGLAVVTVVAAGPAGGSFLVRVGSEAAVVTTRGEDVYTTTTIPLVLGDTTAASGAAEVIMFTGPTAPGNYSIAYAQVQLGAKAPTPDRFELRSADQERVLCARYCRLVGAGTSGPSTTSNISFPLSHPVSMRQGPTWIPAGGSVSVVNIGSGALTSNPSPSWTTGYASTEGIRLVTTGWSGLTSGATQMVTTPIIGLLHADY